REGGEGVILSWGRIIQLVCVIIALGGVWGMGSCPCDPKAIPAVRFYPTSFSYPSPGPCAAALLRLRSTTRLLLVSSLPARSSTSSSKKDSSSPGRPSIQSLLTEHEDLRRTTCLYTPCPTDSGTCPPYTEHQLRSSPRRHINIFQHHLRTLALLSRYRVDK
ncbi:hypothetical protein BDD12DRAFT_813794, partial [Trichophaea hybrida]